MDTRASRYAMWRLHAPPSREADINPNPKKGGYPAPDRVTFLTGANRDFPNWRRHAKFMAKALGDLVLGAWLVIRHEILWKRRVELLLLQPLGSVALQIGYERGYCRVLGISRRTEGLCWHAPELFSKIWGHQVGR